MKFQILNNEKLQFFNDVGELTGEIFLSGSGDMLITPTSASGDIILGSEDVVGSVEIGNVNVPATLSLLGGGTITSNGNTLTIGDSGSGDQVIIGVPITASNVISSSYALTASHALNAGGGGGGSTFPFTGDARITGSLIVSGAFEPRGLGGETNVVIGGAGAGSSISSAHATHNVIIGYDAAEQLNDEDYNVIIGSNAGNFLTHGVDNVLIGGRTGRNFKGTTGNKIRGNTLVGHYAGYGGTNANSFSANNTGLGEQVLHEIDGGSGSIAIGYFAGYNIGSGNNNIIIGSGSLGTTTMNDQLRIGHASLHIISGSLSTGDVIFYNTASAPNFSGSFQGDGSNLTGTGTTIVANPGSSGAGALSTITIGAQSFSVGGGGGGSSIFTAADGFQKTINNLIVSQSNTTSSLTVINSGSTVFDVRGSVGQLFEVQDGLDGVLMSVNDISGIPILTVSSSGDVILAEGSTLQGTAATASFVAGVSEAFPFAGAAIITGSLDITGSGDDIFKVRSSSGSLFSVDDGLDGILMSVNDISGLPLFEVSSSGDVEIVTGNISGSITSTASFGHLMNNGVNFDTAVSSSAAAAGFGSGGGGGGSVPTGTVSGSAQITQLGL